MEEESIHVDFRFLEQYHVSPTHGFLLEEPLTCLPPYFSPWQDLCSKLPELFEGHLLREEVGKLPLLDHEKLDGYRQWIHAHLLLSFLAHGYVWQEYEKGAEGVITVLPKALAVPLHGVSQHLGIKPVVSHPSALLSNYTTLDKSKPLCMENMRNLYCPRGGEKWEKYMLITSQVEIDTAKGLRGVCYCKEGKIQDSMALVKKGLQMVEDSLKAMRATMPRFYKESSPEVFFHVIGPFIAGFGGGDSLLPDGLIFEGVSETPFILRGWSAAQSSGNHTFDALLGAVHDAEPHKSLEEWRGYMPRAHREFIEAVRGIGLKDWVVKTKDPTVTEAFEACELALRELRSYHLRLVTSFVISQIRKEEEKTRSGEEPKEIPAANGQPVIPFLKSIRDAASRQ